MLSIPRVIALGKYVTAGEPGFKVALHQLNNAQLYFFAGFLVKVNWHIPFEREE